MLATSTLVLLTEPYSLIKDFQCPPTVSTNVSNLLSQLPPTNVLGLMSLQTTKEGEKH